MVTAERYRERRDRLRSTLTADAGLILGLSSIRYFAGYSGSNAVLWLDGGSSDRDLLITDGRYTLQAEEECPGLTIDTQSERGIAAVVAASPTHGLTAHSLAVDGYWLTWPEYQVLGEWLASQQGSPLESSFAVLDTIVDLTSDIAQLRAVKDEEEFSALGSAAHCAEAALIDLIEGGTLAPGQTEAQIAARLDYFMALRGSQGISFDTIVGTGVNSALPHHSPDSTVVVEGDLIVVDFGAIWDGYHSDCTRTFCVGEPEPWAAEIADVVWEAHAAALSAVTPGVEAGEIDKVARDLITEAGYGKYFGHSTGHGVGLDIHEPPWLRTGSTVQLDVGSVFTIEPGIYLPGRGGVRIENTYVIEESGKVCSLQLLSPKLQQV